MAWWVHHNMWLEAMKIQVNSILKGQVTVCQSQRIGCVWKTKVSLLWHHEMMGQNLK